MLLGCGLHDPDKIIWYLGQKPAEVVRVLGNWPCVSPHDLEVIQWLIIVGHLWLSWNCSVIWRLPFRCFSDVIQTRELSLLAFAICLTNVNSRTTCLDADNVKFSNSLIWQTLTLESVNLNTLYALFCVLLLFPCSARLYSVQIAKLIFAALFLLVLNNIICLLGQGVGVWTFQNVQTEVSEICSQSSDTTTFTSRGLLTCTLPTLWGLLTQSSQFREICCWVSTIL